MCDNESQGIYLCPVHKFPPVTRAGAMTWFYTGMRRGVPELGLWFNTTHLPKVRARPEQRSGIGCAL